MEITLRADLAIFVQGLFIDDLPAGLAFNPLTARDAFALLLRDIGGSSFRFAEYGHRIILLD